MSLARSAVACRRSARTAIRTYHWGPQSQHTVHTIVIIVGITSVITSGFVEADFE
jgi:hypothetical protein